MLEPAVKRLIERKIIGYLATINEDGSPHVTPTWLDTDGKFILINSEIKRVKVQNTKRDPRISIAFVDDRDPYNGIVIMGKVLETIDGQAANEHADKMNGKYMGINEFPDKGPGITRVILKIEPEKVIHVS